MPSAFHGNITSPLLPSPLQASRRRGALAGADGAPGGTLPAGRLRRGARSLPPAAPHRPPPAVVGAHGGAASGRVRQLPGGCSLHPEGAPSTSAVPAPPATAGCLTGALACPRTMLLNTGALQALHQPLTAAAACRAAASKAAPPPPSPFRVRASFVGYLRLASLALAPSRHAMALIMLHIPRDQVAELKRLAAGAAARPRGAPGRQAALPAAAASSGSARRARAACCTADRRCSAAAQRLLSCLCRSQQCVTCVSLPPWCPVQRATRQTLQSPPATLCRRPARCCCTPRAGGPRCRWRHGL